MQVCGNQAPVDKYGMIEYVFLPLILVMWVLVSCTAFSLQHAHEATRGDADRGQDGNRGNRDASLARRSRSADAFAAVALLAPTQECVGPVRGGLAVASVAVLALVCEREAENACTFECTLERVCARGSVHTRKHLHSYPGTADECAGGDVLCGVRRNAGC